MSSKRFCSQHAQ
uniref:Uncharacterized protein n=1 Tax=Anguilla anguilla TaxID=7936 RepID=A0A0E9T9P5_ANGAN